MYCTFYRNFKQNQKSRSEMADPVHYSSSENTSAYLKGSSINDVTPIFEIFDPPPSPCHLNYALKITPNQQIFSPLPFWGDVIYGWSLM